MRRTTVSVLALPAVAAVLVLVWMQLGQDGSERGSPDKAPGRSGARTADDGGANDSTIRLPMAGPSDGTAEVNPLLAATPDQAAPAPAEDDATRTEDDATPAGLRGRVVDPEGTPLADVTVTYMPGERDSARWPGAGSSEVDLATLPTTRTDRDGRFALQVPWSGAPAGRQWNDAPDLVFDADGFAVRPVPCAGMSVAGLDLGDVLLEAGAVMSGRVIDERMRPMIGAVVSIVARAPEPVHLTTEYHGSLNAFLELTTDASGRFVSRGLLPGRVGYDVIVPGYVSAFGRKLQVASAQRLDVGDIVLTRGGSLAGYVVDVAGQGVGGARVYATGRDGRTAFIGFDPGDSIGWELDDARESDYTAHATTDEAGFFSVSGLSQGSLTVYVEALGYEAGKATGLAKGDQAVSVVLQRPARLSVRVVDAETGRPLTAASLSAVRVAFPGETELQVESAGPGEFLVTGAGSSENRLEAAAPGYGRATRFAPGVAPPDSLDVTFGLQRAASLRGVVMDGAGGAVPGAKLRLVGVDSTPVSSAEQITLRTDAERSEAPRPEPVPVAGLSDATGAFRFDDLMPGVWTLHAEADGYAPLRVSEPPEVMSLMLAEGEQHDLGAVELIAEGRITGRVVSRNGDGQAGLEVKVGALVRASARTDKEGRFEFGALLPGVYEVRSDHDATQSVEVAAGGAVDVTLVLREAPRLLGTVSAGGEPLEGSRVFLRESDDRPIWGPMIAERTTHTDARGSYLIELASVGEHKLFVSTRDGTSLTLGVTLAWDEEQRVDVVFGTGGLSGVVRTADGQPIADAWVSAALTDGDTAGASVRGSARTRTGADGRFSLATLWPGGYSLTVRAEGFAPGGSGPHIVPAGGAGDDLVVLLERGATLSGHVTQQGLEVVPDEMDVVLVDPDDGERVSRTGTDAGAYLFEGLAAGRYLLKVAEPGEAGDMGISVFLHEELVQIGAGESVRRDVVLTPPAAGH